MDEPKVFISYSHDSKNHKEWVIQLATDLRSNGIDTILDQWDLKPGQDITLFMQQGISQSDRVILVCSEQYVKKADEGSGGVGYERLIVSAEIVKSIDTHKFIPIIRNNPTSKKNPDCIGARLYINFDDDSQYQENIEELLREILGVPVMSKPPIGPNPFSGKIPEISPDIRVVGPTGITKTGRAVLDDSWFVEQQEIANNGIKKLQIGGQMELRFGLHDVINKSQIELLNSVKNSVIQTFGWPIGIVIDSREEYRPKPFADGIRAELSVAERLYNGGTSYDYWALRNSGDYFLLKSLFEDQRSENEIYFNTRIIRVTETLLFINKLFSNLGVTYETKVSVRITHRGLAGRTLTSSNPNRDIIPATATENESQVQIIEVLGEMNDNLVKNVKLITSPLFMLFDFKEFHDEVYLDIVNSYRDGKVS